jgi:hypothetical protein
MRLFYPIIATLFLLTGCYKGHWDGYKPQNPMENYALDACNCLKKEVKKAGSDVEDLIERGKRLEGYYKNGRPPGITAENATQEWNEFRALRAEARKSFRTFREIPCVRNLMDHVHDAGGEFFDLGKIVADHCLLARVFTEFPD